MGDEVDYSADVIFDHHSQFDFSRVDFLRASITNTPASRNFMCRTKSSGERPTRNMSIH
jgi:hypothetical protein